jgi:hypothetical protein
MLRAVYRDILRTRRKVVMDRRRWRAGFLVIVVLPPFSFEI